MKSLQECRERLAKNMKELRALVEANPGTKWNDTHQAKFVALNKEIEAANADIEEIEAKHQNLLGDANGGIDLNNCAGVWRNKDGNPVAVLGPDHSFAGPVAHAGDAGEGNVSAGSIMRALALGPQNAPEIQALSEGTDSAGGYTVPDLISRRVIDLARAKSHVIKAGAMTVPLDTEKTSIVRIASDPVPAWRLENAVVAESEPTFEAVTFTARSLAVLVKVSRELLEDSVNIDQALQMVLAGSMASEFDRVALLGSGVAPEPTGIDNATGVNVLDMGAADGAALNGYSQLLAAFQLMADGNAEDPTAAIMAPRERFAYAGMVDTNGQPLNRPDIIKSLPLYGTTKIPVDGTHGTATDAAKIYLGDFSKLMIGVRTGLRIEVLKQTFAENLQVAFLCHLRMDVALAQPKAFTVIEGVIPTP